MPGVSSEERGMLSLESYVPVTFFNGNTTVNGEIMAGFEVSSPKFMVGEDGNFVNNRRFLAKSLSFGANPTSNSDEWHDKEEGFVSSCSSVPALVGSPFMQSDALSALHKFLPSNNEDEATLPGADAYSCDEFRMYEFKVRRCMRGRSHDWTECPFAHPGEKARRRDPRRFHYSGTACPDFRKGSCRRGDACEFAHGVFECWLHPARYRTQPCKDGRNCRRRVCFFAHTPHQLRLVPAPASPRSAKSPASASVSVSSYDGSPLRQAFSAVASFDGALSWDGGVSNSMGYLEGVSSPRGGGGAFCKSNLSQSLSQSQSQSQNQSQSHVQVQMSSPTSTLVGQTQSPPSLSPPLSPAGSPPLSPSNWPLVAGVWNASPAFSKALNQMSPAVAMSNMDSPSASFALQSARRHPSITIPLNDGQGGLPSPSRVSNDASCPASSYSPISTNPMADLVTSFQHLELKNGSGGITSANHWLQAQAAASYANHMGGVSVHNGSPRASNLRHCSYSLPCTPTKSRWGNKLEDWECSEEPMQRVESGRDLRAKIYGKLSRENLDSNTEASPDLGWVNELVK